ncbi:MAG: NUDIX domain-containing protein [Candidatus Uhrbacteria bacterium]|nr:NUDIX domain-containing protein [Candidatus Uhrbacteria bacterium]
MSKENPLKGEKHYTSTVFVITDIHPRKVLLIHHRKLDKWMPPGGHQEDFENPYQTAIRETKEETNIDITEHLPKPKSIDDRALSLPLPRHILEERIDARGDQPEHYHLDMIYVVAVSQQQVTHRESESHSIGWFTQEETTRIPMFENVAILISSILSEEKQESGTE